MRSRFGARWGWIAVAILALVLAMSLAACSDDTDEDDAATDAPLASATPEAANMEPAAASDTIAVIDPWVRATVSGGAMAMDSGMHMGEGDDMAEGENPAMDADMSEDGDAGEGESEGASEDMGEMSGEMPGGMDLITAACMPLENPGGTDQRLVAVESDATDTVEIHETTVENDVMQMRPIEGVEIPAGGSVVLQPGGKHIMLINVPELNEGDTVSLTPVFESGETLVVEAPVRPLESMRE